jgi:signal transduction histidine kinase/CheY-like chemotaxis protein
MRKDQKDIDHTTHQVARRNVNCSTSELKPVGDPKLVVLVGTGAGHAYALDTESYIGRQPDCDIWLPDGDVSRRHAVVKKTDNGDVVLRDLGSSNGTMVNGTPVEEHVLKIGDMIRIGASTVLHFTHHDVVQEQLQHLQKMEALGQLAGGVAHDFNNLMAVIANNLPVMRGESCDRATLEDCIQEIQLAVEHGASLTKSLLDFAHSGALDEKALDLSQLVNDVTMLAQRTFDRAIQFKIRTQPNQSVTGDRSQLFQVLMNILLNAQEAMPMGGQLTVTCETLFLDANEVAARSLSVGPHVRISIKDSGVGMGEETKRRVFEPFFTTKDASEGTGLGLSMAYGIVKRHRGHIELQSERGQGSEFTIYLPLLPEMETAQVRRRALTPELPQHAQGGILVVDDDTLVRNSTSRLLRSLGFDVLTASDGTEAVSIFEELHAQIDLVLLDMVMPNLDGTQTFHILKKLDPEVNVLLTSGYTDHQDVDALLELGARGFISKPHQASKLSKMIMDLLAES